MASYLKNSERTFIYSVRLLYTVLLLKTNIVVKVDGVATSLLPYLRVNEGHFE